MKLLILMADLPPANAEQKNSLPGGASPETINPTGNDNYHHTTKQQGKQQGPRLSLIKGAMWRPLRELCIL